MDYEEPDDHYEPEEPWRPSPAVRRLIIAAYALTAVVSIGVTLYLSLWVDATVARRIFNAVTGTFIVVGFIYAAVMTYKDKFYTAPLLYLKMAVNVLLASSFTWGALVANDWFFRVGLAVIAAERFYRAVSFYREARFIGPTAEEPDV